MLIVNVPVPTVIVPLLVKETDFPQHVDPDIVIVGLLPRGIVVPEAIVKFIVPEVPLLMVTALKVIPEASTVALPNPSKVTVGLVGKVDAEFIVKLPETVMVGLLLPIVIVFKALLVKLPLKSMPVVKLVAENVPLLTKFVSIVKAVMLLAVIVPLFVKPLFV